LSEFWIGFWKEAYRLSIWFNPFPWVQKDVAIKSNESTPMLMGRLTADVVAIAIGAGEFSTGYLAFMAGPAECVAGILAAGEGEFITCPGAVLQMAGAAILAGEAVVSGAIAVRDGAVIVSMLRSRNGGGGGGVPSSSTLARNMQNAGRPRPPNSEAHHIVAGNDPRAAQSRAILQRAGIDINDADNGAWLPDVFHDRVHTDAYYTEVNAVLRQAEATGNVRGALKAIGDAIETGRFP
jgi:hypothetical protein